MLRFWRLLVCAILIAGMTAPLASAAELWRTVPPTPTLPAEGTAGYADTDGVRIWYEVFGAGPPVILLHGGFANSDYWANQVRLLQPNHTVIVIDSRGHGRSSRDGQTYTYELMANDVVGVMDKLKLHRATVVGWSDGAIIGLVMAMKHPDRVNRVFAFAANTDPSGLKPDVMATPTFGGFVARTQAEYAKLSPTPDGFAAFASAIEHMWESEPNYKAADLARITTPVAIVDGDHDEAIKRDHTEYMARNIPGAQLIILPGVSHFAFLQDPDGFNQAMLGFIDQR